MIIIDARQAYDHLRNHYETTRTAAQQPSVINPVPADVFGHRGFMFAVVWPNGARAIVYVGRRGAVDTIMSFTEYAWEWLKAEWRFV